MSTMTTRALLLAALLLLGGAPAAAVAQVPCADELRTMCSGVAAGNGRILSCLRARWGDLTPACRATLDRAAANAELQLHRCEEELFQFCRTVPATRDATLACLASNTSSLGDECRAAVEQAQGRAARLKAACASETSSSCSGVADDPDKLTACLARRSSDLSPACQAALKP